MRPMERAPFLSALAAKKLRGLCVCAAALYGNAASRMSELVSSSGSYAYGGYPDIDALYAQQALETDRPRRETMLHQFQQLLHERVRFGPIWQYIWPSGVGPRVAEPALINGNIEFTFSSPLCSRPPGGAGSDAGDRANRSLSHANRVSGRGLHRAPGNGFSDARDGRPQTTHGRSIFAAETARPVYRGTARKLRAICRRPGNAGSQWTAWWGWKDSNLQPRRYE